MNSTTRRWLKMLALPLAAVLVLGAVLVVVTLVRRALAIRVLIGELRIRRQNAERRRR